MNVLQHLDKILHKHHARLRIDPRPDAPEIVLSLPARLNTDGTIAEYAVEYRLGAQFPQPTPQSEKVVLEDDTEWEEIRNPQTAT